MKAVGLYRYLPIDQAESLVDVDIPKPEATGRDLLVKVEAISVNPVDYKVRPRKTPSRKRRACLAGTPPARWWRSGRTSRCSRSAIRFSMRAASRGRERIASSIWSTSALSGASRRRSISRTQPHCR